MDLNSADLVLNARTWTLLASSTIFLIALLSIPALFLFWDRRHPTERKRRWVRNVGLLGVAVLAFSAYVHEQDAVDTEKVEALIHVRDWAKANDLGDITPQSAADIVQAAQSGKHAQIAVITKSGPVAVIVTDKVRVAK